MYTVSGTERYGCSRAGARPVRAILLCTFGRLYIDCTANAKMSSVYLLPVMGFVL